MKKAIAILGFLAALFPIAALAEVKGYIGADNYYYVTGLKPTTRYPVKLGGMPVVQAGYANSCGILRISTSNVYKDSDRFEVLNEATGKAYFFAYNSLATENKPPRCKGEVVSKIRAWRTDNGKLIYVSGLTPNRGQKISILSQNIVRRLSTNFCGYFRFKLTENKPDAIVVDGKAFLTDTKAKGRGLACRKSETYFSLPKPPPVLPILEEQFEQENTPQPSPQAGIIDSTGVTKQPTGTTALPKNDDSQSSDQEPFTLPQPEPNFYLVNGQFYAANRPNHEILASFTPQSNDFQTLSITGGEPRKCGRKKLINSKTFTEDYTLKSDLVIQFWSERYNQSPDWGFKSVVIKKGTVLKNFPIPYTNCDS